MRDLAFVLAVVTGWSYIIYLGGYFTGRAEHRREMEEKGGA